MRPHAESSHGGRSLRAVAVGASLASALAVLLCCVGPLAAAFSGVAALAALAGLERYRPMLSAASLLILALAFFGTYRKTSATSLCDRDSTCQSAQPAGTTRFERAVLWIAAAVVALLLTIPVWIR